MGWEAITAIAAAATVVVTIAVPLAAGMLRMYGRLGQIVIELRGMREELRRARHGQARLKRIVGQHEVRLNRLDEAVPAARPAA